MPSQVYNTDFKGLGKPIPKWGRYVLFFGIIILAPVAWLFPRLFK